MPVYRFVIDLASAASLEDFARRAELASLATPAIQATVHADDPYFVTVTVEADSEEAAGELLGSLGIRR